MQDSNDLKKVRKYLDTWLAVFNAKNIEALFSLYHTQSVYANANAPLMRGVDEIKPWYQQAFEMMGGTLLYKEEAAFIEGKMAVLLGAYYFAPPTGITPPEQAQLTGRVALIYLKNDEGDWKLLFDMDNTPPDITPDMFT